MAWSLVHGKALHGPRANPTGGPCASVQRAVQRHAVLHVAGQRAPRVPHRVGRAAARRALQHQGEDPDHGWK